MARGVIDDSVYGTFTGTGQPVERSRSEIDQAKSLLPQYTQRGGC